MKKSIIILAITIAMATPAAAALDIQCQLGLSTVEGGESSPVVNLKISKNLTNHVDLIGGGILTYESKEHDSSIDSSGVIFVDTKGNHRGAYAGISLKRQNAAIGGGVIYIDFDKTRTETPPYNSGPVKLVDLSGSTAKPFVSLNASREITPTISIIAELMTYEIEDDYIFNTIVGASFSF